MKEKDRTYQMYIDDLQRADSENKVKCKKQRIEWR
jgi:hypothetical protein